MNIIRKYKKGRYEVTVYKAIVPLMRNGYFIAVHGELEVYWDPDGYLSGTRSSENPMRFFPHDGGEPVRVTSSMWRWIKKVDKNPDCIKGRCDRLQFMQDHGMIKNKYNVIGYIGMCKEIDAANDDYIEYKKSISGGYYVTEAYSDADDGDDIEWLGSEY